MGKSYTYHVIGQSYPDANGLVYIIDAMNKTEMMQEKIKMEKQGIYIKEWYAQTKTGCRMIGAPQTYVLVPEHKIDHINLVKCPICDGVGGGREHESAIKEMCPVCNGSGYTRNNHWNKWRDWQLNAMKETFQGGAL